MNPDENLAEQLRLCRRILLRASRPTEATFSLRRNLDSHDVGVMARMLARGSRASDAWLASGKCLPSAWDHAERNPYRETFDERDAEQTRALLSYFALVVEHPDWDGSLTDCLRLAGWVLHLNYRLDSRGALPERWRSAAHR